MHVTSIRLPWNVYGNMQLSFETMKKKMPFFSQKNWKTLLAVANERALTSVTTHFYAGMFINMADIEEIDLKFILNLPQIWSTQSFCSHACTNFQHNKTWNIYFKTNIFCTFRSSWICLRRSLNVLEKSLNFMLLEQWEPWI